MENKQLSNYLGSYWAVPKNAVKVFGAEMAIFFSMLFEHRNHLSEIGKLGEDDFFYILQDEIFDKTGISHDKQRKFLSILGDLKIIETERRGLPAKNFYRVNTTKMIEHVDEEIERSRSRVSRDQVDVKSNHNNKPYLLNHSVVNSGLLRKDLSLTNSDENGVFIESSSFDQSSGTQPKELPSIQTNLELSNLPVKRFGHNLSATPSISKPPTTEEATAGINALFSQQAKDARAERIAKRKQSPLQNTNEEILMLMEFWASQGFKLPDPQKATKTYNKTIQAIKKVMAGNLIPGDKRKFNPDQIKESIAKFAMYVFDPCYGPPQNVKDRHIRKTGLKGFLYNSFGNGTKSYFIKFVDEEVQERKDIPMVPDKHPEVTNKLRNFFFAYPLAGFKKKLNEKEENHFRLSVKKLDELYQRKGHRFNGITRGVHEMADLLCDSIKHYYGSNVTKVSPGSFSSSFAFSNLIKYMNEQGYIVDDGGNQN